MTKKKFVCTRAFEMAFKSNIDPITVIVCLFLWLNSNVDGLTMVDSIS